LLTGSASDNVEVTSVEIQINSGSYAAATLTGETPTQKNWSYKIPFNTKWTYSFTNTINVRATDKSGNQKVTSLTSIQKNESRDLNGDGYVDLVVGAPTHNSNQGKVYIFNGTSTGITQTSGSNATQSLTGSSTRKFGSSLALTDINGDGFSDLIVCEFAGQGTGLVNSAYYYLGNLNGLGSKTTINQVSGTEYCTSIATGDFNADGYGDVAISDVTSGGFVYIYNGSSTGLNINPVQTIAGASNIGLSLGTGDINGDGKTDLVARTSSSPFLVSYIYSGTSLVSSSSFTTTLNAQSVLGDFNNDGKADLAVGETGFSTNTGRVYIFLSNGTALGTTASQVITGEATNYYFSKTLSVGDANQDGITDLIAGNWDYGSGGNEYGKVYIFYGCTSTGICDNPTNASAANIQITGVTTGLQFGYSTRLIDTNGDGFPDLLAGGPGFNSQGALYIFNGTANGISKDAKQNTNANLVILGETSSVGNFGLSLY